MERKKLKDVRTRFHLSEESHEKLKKMSKKYNLRINQVVGVLIVQALEKETLEI